MNARTRKRGEAEHVPAGHKTADYHAVPIVHLCVRADMGEKNDRELICRFGQAYILCHQRAKRTVVFHERIIAGNHDRCIFS
jgi:hypothetical protein